MIDVLAPVGQLSAGRARRVTRGDEIEAAIEPVDVAIASVRVGDGCDRHDDVVANLVHQPLVFRTPELVAARQQPTQEDAGFGVNARKYMRDGESVPELLKS